MTRPLGLSRRGLLASGVAVIALSAVSTVGIAAASDGFDHRARTSASCSVPALAGSVVTVTLADLRAAMHGGSMMGGGGSMMSQNDWPRFRHGMMTVAATPTSAASGTVSLRVANTGYLTHELIVLPLAAGQQPGQRTVGGDGKLDETGNVGEASATCAAGNGDGIAAGSAAWVTLTLAPGRYELLCNLPGHYLGGMYTELDVS
jgi:uncharacterized cupredoxin-like copper-binding protein